MLLHEREVPAKKIHFLPLLNIPDVLNMQYNFHIFTTLFNLYIYSYNHDNSPINRYTFPIKLLYPIILSKLTSPL